MVNGESVCKNRAVIHYHAWDDPAHKVYRIERVVQNLQCFGYDSHEDAFLCESCAKIRLGHDKILEYLW